MVAVGCGGANSGAPASTSASPPSAGAIDRTALPVAYPSNPAEKEIDARKAKAPARFEVTPPAGAPNVLLVMLDDFGFGQSSAFGGGVEMPTLDKLAADGIRYNNFHVAALCSPTRVALLTGRNHHSANAGAVMDIATAFPGNNGVRPNSITPVAEILRLNGYATAAFGKSHETAPWEVSVSGPTDRWPTRSGFDKFYGFIGGETNQWAPPLRRAHAHRDPDRSQLPLHDRHDEPGHCLGAAGTGPHAGSAVLHVLRAGRDACAAPCARVVMKSEGRFDGGWDRYREETLARQKKLGVVPPDTKLAPKPAAIKDWNALTPEERKVFARQMEICGVRRADRMRSAACCGLDELGVTDNTLVIYIVGDNGASPEGGLVGVVNEMAFFNGVPEPLDEQVKARSKLGGPDTYAHYAAGWAIAGNTPFQSASRWPPRPAATRTRW